MLDNNDIGIFVNGSTTMINFAALSGGAFTGVINVQGETGLVETDFDFTTVLV